MRAEVVERWAVAIAIVTLEVLLRRAYVVESDGRGRFNWYCGDKGFSIASAILFGQGFSSPHWAATGVSAHEVPGFPYFVAVLKHINKGSDGRLAELGFVATNEALTMTAALLSWRPLEERFLGPKQHLPHPAEASSYRDPMSRGA